MNTSTNDTKIIVEKIKKEDPYLLFVCLTGSRAYGTFTDASDYDYRGVFINSPEELYGLTIKNSQEYKKEGGDIVLHSLKEFSKLATAANPNILELLFLTDDFKLYVHPIFQELLNNRDLFLSQKVKYSYSGYAWSQLQRSKCKTTHGTLREAYKVGDSDDPYDSKFAVHTIRLLINGKELITHGTLTPSLSGEDLKIVKDIKTGTYFKNASQFYKFAVDKIEELDLLFQKTKLRHAPDIKEINKLLINLHENYYATMYM